MRTPEQRLDALCRRMSADVRVSELALRVAHRGGDLDYEWLASSAQRTHAIASTTKLFAATLVLRRVAAGDLTLEQPLVSILPRDDLRDLNRYGGVDHAEEITVRDVLAHTSGIPNYYAQKALDPSGDIAVATAADPGWTYEETLELARGMDAPFAPHSGRAQYSFTNYQLVGRLIEAVHGRPLDAVLQSELLEPLGLRDTALLTPQNLTAAQSMSPILHGLQSYRGTRRLASLGAEGAMVSSVSDSMRFLRALLDGEALDPAGLELALRDRLRLFPRVEYGVGIMALTLPRLLTGLPRPGVLVGHAGMTGHVMFADPVSGVCVVGTINQLAVPRLSFRLLLGALRAARPSRLTRARAVGGTPR
ncbi:serine hydrolase domain-containing protein [Microcella sp.]|uniref:serine hydrolase domain-containing protein n=1 Tax=Microcella sp. TaxID=1913979 RepID=UPI003314FA5E